MMFKKITIEVVMAVLWLFKSNVKRPKLKAFLLVALLYFLMGSLQAQENKAVDVTLKGIQIGQQVPDVLLRGLHNYKDGDGKSVSSAMISDFKGKLLILDFWATWCSPCVAMIPRMDSLQRVFGDKVAFLSVTYQTEKEVLPFLGRLEKQIGNYSGVPLLFGDKELAKLFPHVYLPHYVWIDGDGVVRAVTGYQQVDADGISSFLRKDFKELKLKQDRVVVHKRDKPFLVDGNGGDGSSFLGHSILTGYKRGIGGGYYSNFTDSLDQLTLKNLSVSELFAYAFGENRIFFPANRIVSKVRFSDGVMPPKGLTKDTYGGWADDNAFCYELIQPKRLRKSFFSRMQGELTSYFGAYSVSVSNLDTKCLALVRIDKNIKLSTSGAKPSVKYGAFGCELVNTSLGDLTRKLSVQYMSRSLMPIVDDTGFVGRVDLSLSASLTSVDELNVALKKYGLALVEKQVLIPMLVITDKAEMVNNVVPINKSNDGKR